VSEVRELGAAFLDVEDVRVSRGKEGGREGGREGRREGAGQVE